MTNPIPADITNPVAAQRALAEAKAATEDWQAIVNEFGPRLRGRTPNGPSSSRWCVVVLTLDLDTEPTFCIKGVVPSGEMAAASLALDLAGDLGFDVVTAISITPRGPS